MPKVYNKYHKDAPEDAVSITRPSKFGNPFPITDMCTREESIKQFIDYAFDATGYLQMVQRELRGKDLVCCCKPKD